MKSFDPSEFNAASSAYFPDPAKASQTEARDHEVLELYRKSMTGTYSASDSFFFDPAALSTWGRGGDDLPPILRPTSRGDIVAPISDVGAKYGIKNYIKEVARTTRELHKSFEARPQKGGSSAQLNRARKMIGSMSKAYSFDLEVRQKKAGSDRGIAMMFNGPIPATCHVVRPDQQNVHIENLLLGEQLNFYFGENRIESQMGLSIVGFTQHAMTRIWERSDQRHQAFHTAMIKAWRTVEEYVALAEISALLAERIEPEDLPYIAAPFLDGFLILSERTVVTVPEISRYGSRCNRSSSAVMSGESGDFYFKEAFHKIEGKPAVIRPLWLAVTFMSSNDIGDHRRVVAAGHMREHHGSLDARKYVRLWQALYAGADQDLTDAETAALKPEYIMRLQDEMLPRKDPAERRVYALSGLRDAW